MFLGTYRHSVDAKGRVAIPARFREQLPSGTVISKGAEACLQVYPPQDWAQEPGLRPGGVLLGIDRDASALERFAQEPVPPDIPVMLEHTNFAQLDLAAERIRRPPNGVVFDLGLSSVQLDDPDRGFSFQSDGPLDMRLDRSEPWTAADLLNRESESELRRILRDYGQERWGSRIAQRIVERPRRAPF